MRVLLKNYGDVRIFTERPFGYKRYVVQWEDGTLEFFNGLWYREKKVIELVEQRIGSMNLRQGIHGSNITKSTRH